jgi:exopolyphosphatase / guanosine-5'-triphosphate,3'-diphosphate pyrophosphatase
VPTVTTLGAIDTGSNAIRLLIADSNRDGLVRIEAERVPVRLGHGAFTRGELDPATIEAAVGAFARFRTLFDRHGVERYRAVATSALRDSHNGDVLQHRLYHETGIELEVIDGDEEARLIRKAVIAAFSRRPIPRVVLDLGGGSLEVNVREGEKRWKVASLPIGTVRLMETFGITGAIGADEARMVRRYATTVLRAFLPRGHYDLAPAVACGGNSEALAQLCGGRKNGMPAIDVGALEEALPSILDADLEARMARFEVRRDRAEVMGVAALVLATVARELGLSKLLAPGVGIREGVLLELAEAVGDEGKGSVKARADALLASARTFAARVGHDTAHGEQVRRLARILFRRLAPVHGLPERSGVLLEVAALLHDVGEVVDARNHHKHSEYLIRSGRIPGLGLADREVVALLARTHRKSPPDLKKHLAFAALPKERRGQLRKLAALLRLADGLDTDHRQRVLDMDAKVENGEIVLRLELAGAVEPDPSLLRKAALLEEMLGLKLRLG